MQNDIAWRPEPGYNLSNLSTGWACLAMTIDERKPNESRDERLTGLAHLAGSYSDGIEPEHLTGQCLYFVLSEAGFCKIGRTKDIRSRMRSLQNASASPLKLIMFLPGMGWQESVWHAAFGQDRRNGEWFRWSPELSAAIEAARSGEEWIATLNDRSPNKLWRNRIADLEEIQLDRFYDRLWASPGFVPPDFSDVPPSDPALRARANGGAA